MRSFRELSQTHPALSVLRKFGVTVVGFAVLVAGIIMLVTPGPALVLIPVGLAILATEYAWAKRWLEKARAAALKAREKAAARSPQTRRRHRIAYVTAGLVLLAAAAYVVVAGWPDFAVQGWNRLQRLAPWLPELPGM